MPAHTLRRDPDLARNDERSLASVTTPISCNARITVADERFGASERASARTGSGLGADDAIAA